MRNVGFEFFFGNSRMQFLLYIYIYVYVYISISISIYLHPYWFSLNGSETVKPVAL